MNGDDAMPRIDVTEMPFAQLYPHARYLLSGQGDGEHSEKAGLTMDKREIYDLLAARGIDFMVMARAGQLAAHMPQPVQPSSAKNGFALRAKRLKP